MGKSLYGTEADPVNCSFFLRIGACRHGQNCPKRHVFPNFGNTLMIHHLWIPPKRILNKPKELAKHYDRFCEDLLEECLKYGNVMDFQALKNVGDHMIGNVFLKFSDEDEAADCLKHLRNRFYAGRKVSADFSPIADFDNARCRDYQTNSCKRGNFCNFAHFMRNPRWTADHLNSMSAQERLKRKRRKLRAKRTKDGWPAFPVAGSTSERKRVLEKWNNLLKEQRAAQGKAIPPGLENIFLKDEITESDSKIKNDNQNHQSGLQLFRPGMDG